MRTTLVPPGPFLWLALLPLLLACPSAPDEEPEPTPIDPFPCDASEPEGFDGVWAIGDESEAPYARITSVNMGDVAAALAAFSGDPGFASEPQTQQIPPGSSVSWDIRIDDSALAGAGQFTSTLEVTATAGSTTTVCTYDLRLDVTEPAVWLDLDHIVVDYVIGDPCDEPLGSARVVNNSEGWVDGWAVVAPQEFLDVEPAMGSSIAPGEEQRFDVFLDCPALPGPGDLLGSLELHAADGVQTYTEEADVFVTVTAP